MGMEGNTERTPNYKVFLKGMPTAYSSEKEPLRMALTLNHKGQSPRNGPIDFAATLYARFGEDNSVTWIGRRSLKGVFQITQENGFGEFFGYLDSMIGRHVYKLMGEKNSVLLT